MIRHRFLAAAVAVMAVGATPSVASAADVLPDLGMARLQDFRVEKTAAGQSLLRYSAIVYNAKQSGGKPQLTAQTIISRDDKIIYRSPEQPVVVRGGDATQSIVVEQIGLPKAAAGRYVLTLVITDTLADKKNQTIARSIDFNLVD